MNTVERARGRWKEILAQLVAVSHLQNRHGPCPMCGGKDRFRFDDKNGEGTYYCNQCGAGTGIILLRKFKDWTHADACSAVDEIIGKTYAPTAAPTAAKSEGRAAAAIWQALERARDRSVVDAYLTRRGVSVGSPVLRGDARCAYYDKGGLVRHFPAVVAPITAPDGALESVQRIYDANLDPDKKTLPPVRTINGGAVRLFEAADELAVTEGVVTGLAVRELYGLPVWATLSTNGLLTFQPPAGLIRLHVFADNDANYAGQSAAYALAARLGRQSPALEVKVNVPPEVDTDWADVLTERRVL